MFKYIFCFILLFIYNNQEKAACLMVLHPPSVRLSLAL